MPLSEFLTPGAWAIVPSALEHFHQILLKAMAPGDEQAPPPLHAASPSSVPDDGRPVGYSLQDGVAILSVHGIIARRSGKISFFGLTFKWGGQDTIREDIAAAMQDPGVKAVLLSFDSPGGVASGVKELADFISAQTAKPIYAYADGLCTSAAYWLAAATGRVYAPIIAQLGGIGALSTHVDRSAANAAMGIRVTYITSGAWKAAGNPDAPLSASDHAYMQELISKLHAVFRDGVAASMPVDAKDPKAWGDGQIFLAETALELGLISGIVTDRDELIARITKETHMDKEELAKTHPELLAAIQAEAREETERTLAAAQQKQMETVTLNMTALMTAVAGKEAAEQVGKLAAAGFTAAQIEAIAPLLAASAAPTAENAKPESEGRKEVLALLRNATPAPVNTSVASKGGDAIQAAIDKISAISA
jgi:signal peptide peptidase SppA